MHRTALLANLIVLCGTLLAQSPTPNPPPYSTTASDAASSVHQWEAASRLKVDPAAAVAIAEQARQMDLSNVSVPAEHHDQALAWTKDALVRGWLYAVLDRNRTQPTITKAQVEAYTLGEFIRSAAQTREPFGIVELLSWPMGAKILRDQQEIGRTPMGFPVSGDTHVYDIVLSKSVTCESTIQVRPGTTERMTCPE